MVNIVMIIGGIYLISENLLTLGGLVACTILSGRALTPLAQIAGLLSRYQHSRMAYESLSKLMALPVERPPGKVFLRREKLEGQLEFVKVSFKYPDQPVAALDGINLR